MATRIQIRRDTEANWSSNDPILASGELALSTDVDKIKIGDSSTAWSSLSYATIGQSAVETLITTAIDNLVGGAPDLLNTLDELAQALGDDESFITTVNTSITNLETAVGAKASLIVSDTVPTNGPDGTEDLQEGDIWYDRSTGHAYMYYDVESENYVWVEMGGSDSIASSSLGTNSHNFSTTPSDGDVTNGYEYDSTRNAWQIVRTAKTVANLDDVTITSPVADNVIMYNASTSEWENVPGVRLDGGGLIPLADLANVVDGATNGTLAALETYANTTFATAADLSTLSSDVSSNYALTSYVDGNFALSADVAQLTVKTAAEWGTDTSTPAVGSLNVETGGSEILLKIGDGSSTYANLDYVPSNAYVDSTIATALATYATKASPTFTGTVSLPADTSIGNVDATEIGYLDGVTSAIQTQLTDLDTTKADLASPTFTGTVSGIDKTMVGLGNVDNTSDADKPVSTATQTALDAKAALAGATFTGDVTVDTNLTVDGNLTVNGTTFNASSTSIVIEDNMVQLAHQNSANTVDLGLVVAYNDGSANHAGIVRDVSDDTWKLFKGVSTEPATTVAFGEGSLDDLAVNNLTAAGVVFTDGTQTKAGVPSLTSFTEKTASYTLDTLDHQDNIVEMNSASAVTFTIPTNAALAWPVGASMDIFATGTGAVTIAGDTGVTVNATPGLTLRTQWSSATILKRGTDSWVVYGDLKA